MPIKLFLFYLILFSSHMISSCGSEEERTNIDDSTELPNQSDPPSADDSNDLMAGIGEARDISSFELVDEMGVGWNLGNYFDVQSRDKTLWGNPKPTKSVIDAVYRMGFKTLRIPITWGYHQSENAPYTIEEAYLKEIKEVVDFGFQNKMHVIINVHHDNDWVIPTASGAEKSKDRLASLWTQVADVFQPYNDSLIFETLNEPRLEGSPEEWTGGTSEGRKFINEFHQVAVDAIRATGGNNTKRHIMIPTWAASTVSAAMDELVIPSDDPNTIISLHSYFPWPFAGEASIAWGSDNDKNQLQNELERIRQKWIVEENRPVILGEWGTIDKNDISSRVNYAKFYAREAAMRGLLTIVWDDGGMFRLYDRHSLSWVHENIASTIVRASE